MLNVSLHLTDFHNYDVNQANAMDKFQPNNPPQAQWMIAAIHLYSITHPPPQP